MSIRKADRVGLPCITISVCCMIATSVRLPSRCACTSPRVIASVRPGFTTKPSATMRSPSRGRQAG